MIVSPVFENILKASDLLMEGQLVAIPTETVYGLAANALDDQAVARIYELKRRPQFNPLIIHFHAVEYMQRHVVFDESAIKLAQAFWPGPLTMILPRRKESSISLLASAGLDTLAVRIPRHTVALEILQRIQLPLAAPSANPSQGLSPTTAEHVKAGFCNDPRLSMIIDGGSCSIGLESTIIDLSEDTPVILRPGCITADAISKILQHPIALYFEISQKPKAPGMLQRHYAPSLSVRLNVTSVASDEALLAFGQNVPRGAAMIANLSPSENLTEAAANLFKMMRQLDQSCFKGLAVMPIPMVGIGVAINDRLRRAASK